MVQGITFFDDEEDAALLQLLRRWTVAFVRSLTVHAWLLLHGAAATPIAHISSVARVCCTSCALHDSHTTNMLHRTLGM